jgi:hypothetical protein
MEPMSMQDEKLAIAKQTVKGKLDFIRHFVVYAIVTATLAIINNVTWRGFQWWLWPALGWGVGVFAHFLTAFVLQGGGLESKLVEREMKKMEGE